MRRYKLFASIALLFLILAIGAGVLLVMLRHESAFYLRLSPPPGPERQQESHECFTKLAVVADNILHHIPEDWDARFTAKELNSYFSEDFETSGMSEQLLPDDVSDPRVSLEEDGVVRLGFRYGKQPWRTLITIAFKIWLAKDEPNAVCMELMSVHAGGVPISAQGMIDKVFDVARRQNIDVAWYNYKGHQTAVLRFQSSGSRTGGVLLKTLEVQNGELIIGGQANDISSFRAFLPMNRQDATD
jgi:hypothetical protein